ncbi:hypothetical protein ScPMuIL_000912 [Solemya velum]
MFNDFKACMSFQTERIHLNMWDLMRKFHINLLESQIQMRIMVERKKMAVVYSLMEKMEKQKDATCSARLKLKLKLETQKGEDFKSIEIQPGFKLLDLGDPALHDYGEPRSDECPIIDAGCKNTNGPPNDQVVHNSIEKRRNDEPSIVVAGCVIKKVIFWFIALSLVPLVCCRRDIRLMRGNVEQINEGRIEILHDGQYGTICNNKFDEAAARVACRMLGFDPDGGVELYNSTRFGEGNGKIWLDEIVCDGSEQRIEDCKHGRWGVQHCGHGQDVGLACFTPMTISGIRLMQGDVGKEREGRLEILYDGQYGTICNNKFDEKAARVACRMLGFDPDGGVKLYNSTRFGEGEGKMWLNEVSCDGSEPRLQDCKHGQFGVDRCDHGQDVSLACLGQQLIWGIRLMQRDVGEEREGRIEILYDGQYGTICNKKFDEKAARVACRMLGFDPDGGVELYNSTRFGEGEGEIWLDEVSCDGSENRLQDCKHGRFGVDHCDHGQDVGLACLGQQLIWDIRLMQGDVEKEREGRIEILYDGQYGTICNIKFDEKAARVVCRMLGFDPDGGVKLYNSTRFGEGKGEIWLDEVSCNGSENRLQDCKHGRFGVDHCDHGQDVGLACLGQQLIWDIRLMQGDVEKEREGRIEILYDGQYGTICNIKFDEKAARVVCRMLGFDPDGGVKLYNSTRFGEGKGEIWLDEVSCNGSENRLQDCKHGRFGVDHCDHGQDVGLACLGQQLFGGIRLIQGDVGKEREGRLEILYDVLMEKLKFTIIQDIENAKGKGNFGWMKFLVLAVKTDYKIVNMDNGESMDVIMIKLSGLPV